MTRFEDQDLTPYAEPVSANELKEGSIYFAVQFADPSMLIPIMETLVFVGSEKGGLKRYLRFQTIDSYKAGIKYDSATDEEKSSFQTQSEDQLNHIFDYERALNELMKCAVRRRGGMN